MSDVGKIKISLDNGLKNIIKSYDSHTQTSDNGFFNKVTEVVDLNEDEVKESLVEDAFSGALDGMLTATFGGSSFGAVMNTGGVVESIFSNGGLLLENLLPEKDLGIIKDIGEGIAQIHARVNATVATIASSLIEGVLQFGEAIVDFLILVGSGILTIGTGVVDGVQAISGLISGEEWESVTGKLWNGTMGVVSKKAVTSLFDSFYENTSVGSWIKEDALGFDTVRAIGSGVGYVAGVVGLTIATAGIGGALVGGSSAAASGAATAASTGVSAAQLAVTAGAAGVGKGTQDAWADGAGLGEGLGFGVLNGLWEGLQFYVGGRIGAPGGFGDQIASKLVGGSSQLAIKLTSSLSRVLLDGIDGGVEGFVQPLLSTIYKDGYLNENGEVVQFEKTDNFLERYGEIYDDFGGWGNVLTNAAIGSFSSLIGEGVDFSKSLKNATNYHSPEIDSVDNFTVHKSGAFFSKRGASTNVSRQELYSNLDAVVQQMNELYGDGMGIKGLKLYLETGNNSYITRQGNCRNYISTLSVNDIQEYLDIQSKRDLLKRFYSTKNDESFLNEMSNFFEENYFRSGQYGVDQADIEKLCTYHLDGREYSYREARLIANYALENGYQLPHFRKIGTNEYMRLKQKLMDIGFSNSDASVILSSVNDAGACSYASLCNNIFYQFRNTPDLFEKIFGYPMYHNVDSRATLNSTELLLDIYLFVNDVKNGGRFFKKHRINSHFLSTKIDVFGRRILRADEQVYLSGSRGRNTDVINRFLNSKSANLSYDNRILINNFDKKCYNSDEIQQIVKVLKHVIEDGFDVSLDYFYIPNQNDKVIRMFSYNPRDYADMSTDSWKEGAGHSVAVTGLDQTGFIVTSWGQKYKIPFEDVLNGGRSVISVNKLLLKE